MRVLITGGDKGLGKWLAYLFAEDEYELVLLARDKEALLSVKEELFNKYHSKVEIIAKDLSKPRSVDEVCKYLAKKNLTIDVLVNNAGFGEYKDLIDGDITDWQNMLDLNNRALMSLTYYLAKDMSERKSGSILNISSIGAFLPSSKMAVYYASKSFVLNFSLALRTELKKHGVNVTVLCPGPINTDFWNRAGKEPSLFKRKFFMKDPDEVAVYAYELLLKKKAYGVCGFYNKIVCFFARIMPISLLMRLTDAMQSKL